MQKENDNKMVDDSESIGREFTRAAEHCSVFRDNIDELSVLLKSCNLCGNNCGIDRTLGQKGPCGAGLLPKVASWLPHRGEEPSLSGTDGSGTIFFCGCSLHCMFCQNYTISQFHEGREVTLVKLSKIMLELQKAGCHNINLVSPTHYGPQIRAAITEARKQGLCLPIAYNSHGYDSPEALKIMEGKVDIYLPDMKYDNNSKAEQLSGIKGYRESNRKALQIMFSQVGHLQEDPKTGLAGRGLMVRILLLPDKQEGAMANLAYLKEHFSDQLCISLMAQYAPLYKARQKASLNRTIFKSEYDEVVDFAKKLGFSRLWFQDPRAAFVGVPDFSDEKPFVF